MSLLLVAVLASNPIAFETMAREATDIVVGRVTLVERAPSPRSTLEIEVMVRGAAAKTIVVAGDQYLGERALFFLRAAEGGPVTVLGELRLSGEFPGQFQVMPSRVALPAGLVSEAHELSAGLGVPIASVMSALGSTAVIPPQTPAFRVGTATCAPCDLSKSLAALPPLGAHIDCGTLGRGPAPTACVEKALTTHDPFIVKEAWSGIDSGGTSVFLRDAEGKVTHVWYDNDVTGGTGPQCASAVFAERCRSLTWSVGPGPRRLSCPAESMPPLCHEWDSRRGALGAPRPLAELRCDGVHAECAQPRPSVSQVCRTHRGGKLYCHPE